MTDVAREKYAHLMAQIEELEERVSDLEREGAVAAESPDARDVQVVADELHDLREELAARRNELQRISDGCGTPRATR